MPETPTRLHLGCELNTPEGWINVDGSWNAWLAQHPILRRIVRTLHLLPRKLLDAPFAQGIVIHDVRKPLPFADNSMTAVYASHLLEHLYLVEAQRLLKECHRVLKPGGVLRVVVPDMQAIIREYNGEGLFAEDPQQWDPGRPDLSSRAEKVNRRFLYRNPEPPQGNMLYRLYTILNDFHSHKWMYDAESMALHMRAAGFTDVEPMGLNESHITGIEKVELPGRVLDGQGVCVEGLKPVSVGVRVPAAV